MNGFYLAIGKQGSGKTALITKHCYDNYILDKSRQVYSNYTLKSIPHEKITLQTVLDTLKNDPHHYDNSIMLFDEIHVYFDSLDFMKRNNREMQIYFSQLRKRNILLLATTQYLMNVDVRIRRQCMNVFEMNHIHKGLFEVITHEIDGYFSTPISKYRVLLEDYFRYYDTNELILE